MKKSGGANFVSSMATKGIGPKMKKLPQGNRWSCAHVVSKECADCVVMIVCNNKLPANNVVHTDEMGDLMFTGDADEWRAQEFCLHDCVLEFSTDVYSSFIKHTRQNKIKPLGVN